MKPGDISLDYIGRRLDDLQNEATHNRQVGDFILKQMHAFQAEFDAHRAHLTLIDGRLDRIDRRLDHMDARMGRHEEKLDRILEKLRS